MIERFVPLSFCRLPGVSLYLVGEDVVPLVFAVYTLLYFDSRDTCYSCYSLILGIIDVRLLSC